MTVYFVGAGPGEPDLLTVKALRLLQGCRVCVYAGSLVSPGVLALLPPEAERHDSAGMSLPEIVEVFREAHRRDLDVIRLHAGEPALYGAIGEQMRALDALGIPYEVVPGISAFQAAAAALKAELTAPEIAQTVILTRTAGRTPLPPEQDLSKLAEAHATLCIFLSGDKVGAVTGALLPAYGADCPAALVFHASWPDQQVIRGVLGTLAEQVRAAGPGRTALVLVGRALAREAPASKLYDPGFSHGFRQKRGP